MIFVPLTFVTSIFGMTNMPETPEFWQFGVTLATVCVPFFLLIGFLNTEAGYRIWMRKTKAIWRWIRKMPQPQTDAVPKQNEEPEFGPSPVNRTLSTEEGMRRRLGSVPAPQQSDSTQTHPNIQRIVRAVGEGKQNGSSKLGAGCGVCEEERGGTDRASERKNKVTISRDTVINMENGRS
jgi:hypothetical protein